MFEALIRWLNDQEVMFEPRCRRVFVLAGVVFVCSVLQRMLWSRSFANMFKQISEQDTGFSKTHAAVRQFPKLRLVSKVAFVLFYRFTLSLVML